MKLALGDAHASLSKLLGDEQQLLKRLEQLLQDEKQLLLEDDSPEKLEIACAARQDCMAALLRLQDERATLLRAAGYPSDGAGLLLLIRDCDPARVLPPRWAECAELAKRCRSLNDHNGALVSSRMRRIQGVLELLTGSRQTPPVYGKQAEQSWVTSGRVLATEV